MEKKKRFRPINQIISNEYTKYGTTTVSDVYKNYIGKMKMVIDDKQRPVFVAFDHTGTEIGSSDKGIGELKRIFLSNERELLKEAYERRLSRTPYATAEKGDEGIKKYNEENKTAKDVSDEKHVDKEQQLKETREGIESEQAKEKQEPGQSR